MKGKHMRPHAILLAALALSGCGASISGKYGCGDAMLRSFDFRKDNVVYVNFLNASEMPGTFKLDGDKVAVTLPSMSGLVLTKKGDSLSGTILGLGDFTCKKS
jgi:hypothetical protein